jgi:16S rRNA (cytidine1402-2'-O)-methyltransferase
MLSPLNQNTGKIILIPSFLGEDDASIICESVKKTVEPLTEFIVENAKTARRYLRAIGYKKNFDTEVTIHELDKHATHQNCELLLQNVFKGNDCGLISEAGNPCIADPGNEIVAYAHRKNVKVVPLVGPSSILLALISSGFNGQQFCFNGYIPIQNPERSKKLKNMESLSRGTTQIFMETPFRNQSMFDEILKICQEDTLLCIACDLTLSTQFIKTQSIKAWRKTDVHLHKRYCMFLIGR